MTTSLARVAVLIGLASNSWAAESPFKVATRDEILASSRDLAHDLMSHYKGNETGEIPGVLPGPPPSGDYYWWAAGPFWNTFIDYWRLTGDDTYNALVTEGLIYQAYEDRFEYSFVHPNWTASLGNMDQCVWALAAVSAAESGFPEPTGGAPKWAAIAQNVFDQQVERLAIEKEDGTCDGGLRWQIPPINNGYNYKETLSNGCFFNLGARLGRLNGNETAVKVAEEAFAWMTEVGFIDTETWNIFDGGHVEENCTDINKVQFSANAGIILQGTAFMYNISNSDEWKTRLDGLVDRTLEFFFPENVAEERACENPGNCNTDMYMFKSFLLRSLASAGQLAPHTADKIQPLLESTAKAAVAQCTGGDSGRQCGFYWSEGKFVEPESSGVGEQMSVLSSVLALLVPESKGIPAGSGTGAGTGTGGSNGGNSQTSGGGNSPSGAGKKEIGMMTVLMGLGVWLVNV